MTNKLWLGLVLGVLMLASCVASAAGPEAAWERTAAKAAKAFQQGRIADAEDLLSLAIVEAQKLGMNDLGYAEALDALSDMYIHLGKYSEAEALMRRAIEVRAQALGPNRLELAASWSDLAKFCAAQQEYDKAEEAYQRSLQIEEKTLGPEDRSLTQDLVNLANLYSEEGRYAEAEAL